MLAGARGLGASAVRQSTVLDAGMKVGPPHWVALVYPLNFLRAQPHCQNKLALSAF
jgi:hypothetical protein